MYHDFVNELDEDDEIRGEYWIIDGQETECDGDVGDDHHESVAIGYAQHLVAEHLGFDGEWVEIKKEIKAAAIAKLGGARPTVDAVARALGLDPSLLECANGGGDPRRYAIRNWGWKRVVDSNVETWKLEEEDRKSIHDGLIELCQGDPTVYVYVYTTGETYELKLSELVNETAAPSKSNGEIETAAAANADLSKQYDHDQGGVHPHYRNRPMGDSVIKDVERKIQEGTLSVADVNAIIETSWKSTKERMLRRGRPIDANRMNDDEGHSRVSGPNMTSRTAKRAGGGSLNDPRRTARGRSMLRRQKAKNESKNTKLEDALDLIRQYASPCDLYGLWWHDSGKLRVSYGDWADLESAELHDRLVDLLGKGNVESDAEIGAPEDGGWKKVDLEKGLQESVATFWAYECPKCGAEALTGDPEKGLNFRGSAKCRNGHGFAVVGSGMKPIRKDVTGFSESVTPANAQYPTAGRAVSKSYLPVCPHCKKIMHERHWVPDIDSMKARMQKFQEEKVDVWSMSRDELSSKYGPYLYRHRGECYDKGPFTVDLPESEPAVHEFLCRGWGSEISEDRIASLSDRAGLKTLVDGLASHHADEWLHKLKARLA